MSLSTTLVVAVIWTVAALIVALVVGRMFRQMDDADQFESDLERPRADIKYMRGQSAPDDEKNRCLIAGTVPQAEAPQRQSESALS